MTKNLWIDFAREIRHSLNRFFSIFLIVAVGVAFFAGLRSAAPDMSHSVDQFMDEYNMMDIQVISTLGLTDADIDAISNVEGVESVQPGYFTDALANVNGSEFIFRVHSLPEGYTEETSDNYINEMYVTEGRLPRNSGEIVVEDGLTDNYNVEIGQVLTFTSGTDTEITDGTLVTDSYTVVGKVRTPYYLTYEKGTSQINSASIDLYAYIPQEDFAYEDMYIDCYVRVAGAAALNCFSSKYEKLVDEVQNRLSNIGVDRSAARGDELRDSAQEQLDEAQKQYDEGKEEFDTQIADGQAQLDDAYTQLITGEDELEKEKEKYQIEVDNAEEQIADGEEQLAEAAVEISQYKTQLAQATSAYNQAKENYDATMAASESYLTRLNQLESLLGRTSTQMGNVKDAMEGDLTDEQYAQYSNLLSLYQQLYDTTRNEYNNVKTLNSNLQSTISDVDTLMAETEQQLVKYQNQLDEAQAEYDAGAAELAAGKSELAQKKEEAEKQFAEAQTQIDEGWEEYNASKADFEEQKAEGQAHLDDAHDQLLTASFRIEQIDNATWYILDRSTNYGYVSYDGTIDAVNAIATFVPIFFLLVAVLVCMTTMTRMVSDERGVIGTYKALGYEDKAIASKYIMYTIAASVSGGIIGSVFGVLLFPRAIYSAWSAMYIQPSISQTIHWGTIIISIVITVLAMVATSYYTCRSELVAVPAELMRPKAPKLGKTILMERIPLIWSHLNFSQKVTMRNLFRYKKRMCMTIIGITGCAALLLAGLGMNDTISAVVSNQYVKVLAFDIGATYVTEEDAEAEKAELMNRDGVEEVTAVGTLTATLTVDTDSETATTYVVSDPSVFGDFITLEDRASGKAIDLTDDGIILSELLAENLGLKVGDSVSVTNSYSVSKMIPVIGITENYVFHYAYITQACYEEYYHAEYDQSTLLIKATDETKAQFVEEIKNTENIASVTYYADLAANFSETVSAMKAIVLLIIVCAALLAFIVLYNLTNINITERIREIATIKVLGFKGSETALYIYRENFLLTVIGGIIGLGLGVLLHRVIMQAIEQSNVMFGYAISLPSFIEAFLLTCVFSIAVMVFMYRKLVNIPMVESLKSIE